jgi:restriction system protein
MAIPDYQTLFRPLLGLAAQTPITRASATDAMGDFFSLSPEERQQRIPSGQMSYVRSRVGWAMTYLTKAGLLEKAASRTYAATDRGREFLNKFPDRFGVKELLVIPEFVAFQRSHTTTEATTSTTATVAVEPAVTSAATPHERIDAALGEINGTLRSQLLAALLKNEPEFFERVVIDLLVEMGYGGSRENAAEHVGGVGDEGVDGRINQDALGLDVVVIQAKRYQADNVVGREKLQQFIGAMHGQGATKGVFITTSRFAATAVEYVKRSTNLKVILIDGERLTDLMLQYKIGVRVERHADILALDNNYFEEE